MKIRTMIVIVAMALWMAGAGMALAGENSARLLGWWDERTEDEIKTTTCFRILNASNRNIVLQAAFLDDAEKQLDRLVRRLSPQDLEELCVEELLANGALNLGAAYHGVADFRAFTMNADGTLRPIQAIVGFQKELFHKVKWHKDGTLKEKKLRAASEANLKPVPIQLADLPPTITTHPVRLDAYIQIEGLQGKSHVEAIGTAIIERGSPPDPDQPHEITSVIIEILSMDLISEPPSTDVSTNNPVIVAIKAGAGLGLPPSVGELKGTLGTDCCDSFFDIFIELSLTDSTGIIQTEIVAMQLRSSGAGTNGEGNYILKDKRGGYVGHVTLIK